MLAILTLFKFTHLKFSFATWYITLYPSQKGLSSVMKTICDLSFSHIQSNLYQRKWIITGFRKDLPKKLRRIGNNLSCPSRNHFSWLTCDTIILLLYIPCKGIHVTFNMYVPVLLSSWNLTNFMLGFIKVGFVVYPKRQSLFEKLQYHALIIRENEINLLLMINLALVHSKWQIALAKSVCTKNKWNAEFWNTFFSTKSKLTIRFLIF